MAKALSEKEVQEAADVTRRGGTPISGITVNFDNPQEPFRRIDPKVERDIEAAKAKEREDAEAQAKRDDPEQRAEPAVEFGRHRVAMPHLAQPADAAAPATEGADADAQKTSNANKTT